MFIDKISLGAPTAVALGNFDGLHGGHRLVIEKTLEQAKENGLIPVALLFDEHPRKLLCGKCPPKLLTEESKEKKLREAGFEVVKISFSQAKGLSAEDFLVAVKEKLNVRVLCCGYNYRYGKGASGNVETLCTGCKKLGIELFVSEEKTFENEAVSSTRIRKAIENGEIEKANAMLGREFSYCFEVVSGDKRGRLLGFPTINQFFPDDFVHPACGVYVSKVNLKGKWYPAVTNIGVRPTIGTESYRSETCILGFSGDLYNQFIEVFLLKYTRPEEKFEGLEKLTERIRKDAEAAIEVFGRQQQNG